MTDFAPQDNPLDLAPEPFPTPDAPPVRTYRELIRAGSKFAFQRIGVSALLHVIQTALALLGTFSVYWWTGRATNRLALPLDYDDMSLLTWTGILGELGNGFALAFLNLLWIVPLVWGASAALRMGVAFAASHGGRGIRTGLGHYGWHGAGLAALFGLMVLGWALVALLAASTLAAVWIGAASTLWSYFVVLPVLLFGGWVMLAFAHDHARAAVALGSRITDAVRLGLSAIGRDGPSVRVGVGMVLVSWLLWIAPMLADAAMNGASPAGFWTAFLIGQLLLFVRTFVDVGWITGVAARHVTLREDEMSWLSLRLPREPVVFVDDGYEDISPIAILEDDKASSDEMDRPDLNPAPRREEEESGRNSPGRLP